MPAVPILRPFYSQDSAGTTAYKAFVWSLWQKGLISAANVTWSADAQDINAQQNPILSYLAVNKGYNAIRLVLSAGQSQPAWDDMYKIAVNGWDSSVTLDNGGQPISEIRDNIRNILDKCAQLGLGVILDCHDFFQSNTATGVGPLWAGTWARPAPQTGTLSAAQLRNALVQFWTNTVTAFPVSTYPAIIGYEVLNEPNPDQTKTFNEMETDSAGDNCWSKLVIRCIKAIRAHDVDTPIVVDGIYYADPYGLKYFDPTFDGVGLLQDYTGTGSAKTSYADFRLVYSFHAYGPHEFTHQGVSPDLYGSLGIPYPLDWVAPYSGATIASEARIRAEVYDGSAAWVGDTTNNPSGSTTQHLYLPFRRFQGSPSSTFVRTEDVTGSKHTDAAMANPTGYDIFLARNQPAIDFKTNAESLLGVQVPVFVGEFSAVDTTLTQTDHVPPSADCRVITQISVDGEGLATLTLQGQLKVKLYPHFESNASSSGYGGAYNDFARAKVTVLDQQHDAAYNIDYPLMVRVEDGTSTIRPPFSGASTFAERRTLALYYGDTSLRNHPLGTGHTPVATLTLSPGAYAASEGDNARQNFVGDALKMCLKQGFSWAYWQEDGYTVDASTVNDAGNSGIFVAWRPAAGMSTVLTLAATRRTVTTA